MEDRVLSMCQEVLRVLGKGHSEVVYHRALEVELRDAHVPYETEAVLPIRYKGHVIGSFRVDIIVANELIVELKAVPYTVREDERTQLRKYLAHTDIHKGIVVNFNQKTQEIDHAIIGE
jgi:GxxExxY protein